MALSLLGIAWAVTIVSGCSSAPQTGGAHGGLAAPGLIRGDWEDVGVSMEIAVLAIEATVVESRSDAQSWTFALLTIRDEPGHVVVERRGEDQVVVHVSIGRFGDAAREQRLIRAFADRLQSLYGREFAPLK